jgi:hypothetical protein
MTFKKDFAIWELEELLDYIQGTHINIDGKWLPARPNSHQYYPLIDRFRIAWKVFWGDLDVFRWPKK